MDRVSFFKQIGEINIWKSRGRRAPHKPLLLLLALGRVYHKRDRLVRYGGDIEDELRKLLVRFGPPRRAHHPEEPFTRLSEDGLWEIPGFEALSTTKSGRPVLAGLRRTRGGFPKPLYDLLRLDRMLVIEATQEILNGHFPRSVHGDIRDAVGIPDYVNRRPDIAAIALREKEESEPRHPPPLARRDSRFRHRVLRAYERRCAVCDFDVRIEDQLLGLEAAHIKWHAAGGPDTVPNGLALCSFHHKALDVGALGLESIGGEVTILISSEVNGQSAGVRQLLDFNGESLRCPQSRALAPRREFVAWHQEEVFRAPALARVE